MPSLGVTENSQIFIKCFKNVWAGMRAAATEFQTVFILLCFNFQNIFRDLIVDNGIFHVNEQINEDQRRCTEIRSLIDFNRFKVKKVKSALEK